MEDDNFSDDFQPEDETRPKIITSRHKSEGSESSEESDDEEEEEEPDETQISDIIGSKLFPDTDIGRAKVYRRLSKPYLEDRALQTILSARRKSLECQSKVPKGIVAQIDGPAKPKVTIKRPDEMESAAKIRMKKNEVSLQLRRELQSRRKTMMLGSGSLTGRLETYTDKDRGAAVTFGDQDIKTSLKVKQKGEKFVVVLPEDMDSNVYLMEAQKCLSTGNIKPALICAEKAVEVGGSEPCNLLVRSRCYLKLGKLNEALLDAEDALIGDPSLIKALLVQAETLYTMGEFERSLVLFHRGHKRRADLSSFQKGIHKSREAILNAIGGSKFPAVKSITTTSSLSIFGSYSDNGSNEKMKERRKKMENKNNPKHEGLRTSTTKSEKSATDNPEVAKPLVTEIKTSRMASKKLLGGLSSDKEFLAKLLTRSDLTDPKYGVKLGTSRIGRRRSSVNIGGHVQTTGGNDVINAAKEGLSSLQYLEAFLWQRDPGGLSVYNKGKALKFNIPKDIKRGTKLKDKPSSATSQKKAKKEKCKVKISKSCDIEEKVTLLLNRLKVSTGTELTTSLEEAETFVDDLRKHLVKKESLAPTLSHLLIGIGRSLSQNNRAEDAIAVLKDALQFSKQRCLEEEYRQAAESLGRVLATEGYKEEAVEVWASLIDFDKQSYGTYTTSASASKSSFSYETTTEETNSDGAKLNEESPIKKKILSQNYSDFDHRIELNDSTEITSRS